MLPSWLRSPTERALHLAHGRVYLRPPKRRDWKAWSQLRADSQAFLIPWEPTWPSDALTRRAFRRRLQQYSHEVQSGQGYSFLIFRRSEDTLLGGISVTNVRRGVAQSASLGYWIGRPYARQGYMAEALTAVLDFAFDELNLHRVEAACLPENVASQGLLRKVGFREEGYARGYLRINGMWQDHVLFGILAEDARGVGAGAVSNRPAQLAPARVGTRVEV
jgi:ribosomal-protein-alanine N-acetyltransferase